ncbi:MAG TPA: hypothetical protein VI114_12055, partial [Chthoniobacterales bacterium]
IVVRIRRDQLVTKLLAFFADATIHADEKGIYQGGDGQTDAKFLVLSKAGVNQAQAQNRNRQGGDKKTTGNRG